MQQVEALAFAARRARPRRYSSAAFPAARFGSAVGAHEIGAARALGVEQRRHAVGVDDDRAALVDAERVDGARAGKQTVVQNPREKRDGAAEAIADGEVRVGDRIGERGPREESGGEADALFERIGDGVAVCVSTFIVSPATES